MKKFRVYFILLFLLFLYTTVCAISYVDAVGESISNEVFRLHVIANSDSEEDQNLKYIVRDNVLKYVNSFNFGSKQELIEYMKNNSDVIESIARETILENDFNYDVYIEIGHFDFPTKNYGDISLPAGDYDALRIKIGNAEGQNWWCVMFPPLCFVDVSSGIVDESSKKVLEDNLSEEEYALISTANNAPIQFKFKLFEFFNSFNTILANR